MKCLAGPPSQKSPRSAAVVTGPQQIRPGLMTSRKTGLTGCATHRTHFSRLTVTISLGESLYAQVGTSGHCSVVVNWVFDHAMWLTLLSAYAPDRHHDQKCCAQQTGVHRIVGSNCLIVYLRKRTSMYVRSTFLASLSNSLSYHLRPTQLNPSATPA